MTRTSPGRSSGSYTWSRNATNTSVVVAPSPYITATRPRVDIAPKTVVTVPRFRRLLATGSAAGPGSTIARSTASASLPPPSLPPPTGPRSRGLAGRLPRGWWAPSQS